MLTLPGLIDPHVHLRDPGQTQKEDFYTGTLAALAGGYTTILDMPNNKVPITTLARLAEKIAIAKEKIVCDVGFYFGSMGDNLDEFKKLSFYSSSEGVPSQNQSVRDWEVPNGTLPSGTPESRSNSVFGLKLYLNETTGNLLIDKKLLEKIFIKWSQSMSLHSSILSTKKIKPILVHAEEKKVEDVINVVKKIKTPTHFCHISRTDELKMIINAKELGLPITCGVTPHHLFLTEHDTKALGPFGKMKPPLSSKKDQEYLWKNLRYIDVIESDHAPHTIEEKAVQTRFERGRQTGFVAPSGVPGLETTLPLLLTAVSEKRLTIGDIIRLCYTNPAKIFRIKQFDSSNYRTKVEVDLSEKYTIENKSLITKCKWSPFSGWKVKGKVQKVWLRGTKVFEEGEVLVNPGSGKIILPKRRYKNDTGSM